MNYGPYPPQQYPPHQPPQQRNMMMNGLGAASLTLGIVSILFFWVPFLGLLAYVTAVAGIIIGYFAYVRTTKNIASNPGVAISGIVTSSLGLVAVIGITVVWISIIGSDTNDDPDTPVAASSSSSEAPTSSSTSSDTPTSTSTSSSEAPTSSSTTSTSDEESSATGSGDSETSATASAESTSSPDPDIEVSAAQIVKDFEDNELAADQKYSGKVIQVSGVVEKIDTDLFNEDDYILRIGTQDDWDFLTVDCRGISQEKLANLDVGANVTVVGDFSDGGDLGVQLESCRLL